MEVQGEGLVCDNGATCKVRWGSGWVPKERASRVHCLPTSAGGATSLLKFLSTLQVVLPHPKKQELDVVVFLDDAQVLCCAALGCAVLCCAVLRCAALRCGGAVLWVLSCATSVA